MMLEKEILIIKKKVTILKFKDHLDHGNGDGYLLVMRIYAIPNHAGKTHLEQRKPEGKAPAKMEGTLSNKYKTNK